MNDLVEPTERYLRTDLRPRKKGVVTPMVARSPTAPLTRVGPRSADRLSRMERDGSLHVPVGPPSRDDGQGRALAISVMRSNGLDERLSSM